MNPERVRFRDPGSSPLVLGVVSDSHGNLPLLRRVIQREAAISHWTHCGDGCRDLLRALEREQDADAPAPSDGQGLAAVSGNCDSPTWAPRECLFDLLGTRFLVLHGDRQRVQLDMQGAVDEAHRWDAQVVLYGHTHRADYAVDEGIHLFNPGCLERGSAYASYGRVHLTEGEALRFEILRVMEQDL